MTIDEAIIQLRIGPGINEDVSEEYDEAADMAIEALIQLRDQTEWIPISKEVPEENGYYLTTTMFNQVYCDYWNGVAFDRSETVIAWMPKPAPYKPQESDDANCDDIWEKAYAERDGKK